MTDRQPTPGKEGRVLITPEDGSPAFFATIEMADEPLNEGTPLNKASLLKDSTAAGLGLTNEAVPDDALAKLLSLVNSAQSSADGKTVSKIITYRGTGKGGYPGAATEISADFQISFAMMLAEKYDSQSYYQGNALFESYVIPAEILTNEWTQGIGFCKNISPSLLYCKISKDRKTLEWYTSGEDNPEYKQANDANTTYVVLLIGKV